MKRLKHNFKKGNALLLMIAMIAGIISVMPGQANAVKAATSQGAQSSESTIVADKQVMNIGASHLQGNSGWNNEDGLKIRFGKYNGNVTEYRVLGDTPDTQSVTEETGILLNADNVIEDSHMQFNTDGSNEWNYSEPSKYLQEYYNNENVFSSLEKAAIMKTTLKSHAAYVVNGDEFRDVESRDNYIFLLSAFESNRLYPSDADRRNGAHCWLRSKDSTNGSKAASYFSVGEIVTYDCSNPFVRVTPAFNIKPSTILFTFHSSIDKSLSTGNINTQYSDELHNDNTWKLTLYDSEKFIKVSDSKKAVRDSDNRVSIPFDYMTDLKYEVNQVSVMITDKEYDASGAKILYYGKLDTTTEYEYSSESTKEVFGNGTFVLPEELNNKKWGEDYHLYMMAEHISDDNATDYSSVPKKIILTLEQVDLSVTTPNAGELIDTSVTCNTEGISVNSVIWTDLDDTKIVTAGEKAGYNKKYGISVDLSVNTGYKLADDVTATILGNAPTNVIENANGTLTVTYEFPPTAKDKLESIEAPQAITVANGTSYSDMDLPKHVNIVTEGNTVTSASVTWDITTVASGNYNPDVLTEQKVTLNGIVDCPESIDNNGVTLATTIDITISAAGIVETPTSNLTDGVYKDNQTVAFTSATKGATIYYTITTDGTEPTNPTLSSKVYNEEISLTGAEGRNVVYNIKAIAVKDGMRDSEVMKVTYTISIPAIIHEDIYQYHITEGANQSIVENYDGTVTIKTDGEVDGLVSIFVDGSVVASTNYTVESGLTIITFTKEYLDTLTVGKHTVRFNYTDGYVETGLTITKEDSQKEEDDATDSDSNRDEKDEVPNTGDEVPIIWAFVLMFGSGMILSCTSKRKTVK